MLVAGGGPCSSSPGPLELAALVATGRVVVRGGQRGGGEQPEEGAGKGGHQSTCVSTDALRAVRLRNPARGVCPRKELIIRAYNSQLDP